MRFFIDSEFDEDGRTIKLISLAVVAENGREFYACDAGFDERFAQPWVRQNVLPKLPPRTDPAWMTRGGIREAVREFLDADSTKPEIWGYYCVVPETRVLTAKLEWVPIGDLTVGAELTAFDESTRPGRGRSSAWRHWRKSIVERAS